MRGDLDVRRRLTHYAHGHLGNTWTGTSAKRRPETTDGEGPTNQVAEDRVGTGPTTVGPSPPGESPEGWPSLLTDEVPRDGDETHGDTRRVLAAVLVEIDVVDDQ